MRKQIESLVQLLRMSHIRHRFAEPLPEPERRDLDLIGLLRTVHPSITVEEALANWDTLTVDSGEREPGEPGPGYRTWKRTGHPFSRTWESVTRRRERARGARTASTSHGGGRR